VVQHARKNAWSYITKEWPVLNKDTATVCNGLRDPEASIRLRAAGLLTVITVAKKEYAGVIQPCIPELLAVAGDKSASKPKDPLDDYVTRARNDALFVLALDPLGTPPQAEAVFRDELNSNNFRSAEVAAAGLLRMKGPDAAANHKLVAEALQNAPDAKHRLNMLYAISGVISPSDVVFQVVRQVVNDPDPEVQRAVVRAVFTSAPDKSQAVSVLQNVEESPTADWMTKKMAEGEVKSIGKQRQ
jgi:hypothetical protein